MAAKVSKLTPFMGGDFHPLLDLILDGPDLCTKDVRVHIAHDPYAKGEFRIAYACRLLDYRFYTFLVPEYFKGFGERLVAKESKFTGTLNSRRQLFNQAHIQTVAMYLADEFSRLCAGRVTTVPLPTVKYVQVQVIEVPERPEGRRCFSVEEYIPGVYAKFNNNNGYVDMDLAERDPALQAFSHFTWHYTKGLVMVVDVQGVSCGHGKYLLTDPAVHTQEVTKVLPDPTNLGVDGMAKFFATHKCNSICAQLKLRRPSSGGAFDDAGSDATTISITDARPPAFLAGAAA